MPMKLTAEQVEQYLREGYLFLPDYFPSADMEQLLRVARDDD
ncbi:MAG: ectoine hydroxylase, partial [Gemmatimonadetes bacterium]|nr:ectoine hydroxylase [Gemmatimonadota bacterium]